MLGCRKILKDPLFERVFKKLVSLKADIETSTKTLNMAKSESKSLLSFQKDLKEDSNFPYKPDGYDDPEYLVNHKNTIIEMKKTVEKHTRSLLRSVSVLGGSNEPEKLV